MSYYSAEDSDNINEYTNYWRGWEEAERLASATTCDWMHHCFECSEICERSEPVEGFIMVMEAKLPTKGKCAYCGETTWNGWTPKRGIANEGKLTFCKRRGHWSRYMNCYIRVMKSLPEFY